MSTATGGTLGGRHRPLRIQVRDELRERIATGELAPGDRLIERDLADRLGVSRVPVREAIRMLEVEGLVRTVPRKGVVVDTMSRRDVEELFDVREALEVMLCKRAAENGSEDGYAELKHLLGEARRAVETEDRSGIAKANAAFHEKIIVLANNAALASMMEPLGSRMRWLFAQTDDPSQTVDEHEQLFAAIASRDADAAAACAAEHVETNRRHVLAMLFDRSG